MWCNSATVLKNHTTQRFGCTEGRDAINVAAASAKATGCAAAATCSWPGGWHDAPLCANNGTGQIAMHGVTKNDTNYGYFAGSCDHIQWNNSFDRSAWCRSGSDACEPALPGRPRGIECGTDGARVNFVSLLSNNLRGPLPEELWSLTGLTKLGLGNNQLDGSIPPKISALTGLTGLDLSGNRLAGPVPALPFKHISDDCALQDRANPTNRFDCPLPPDSGLCKQGPPTCLVNSWIELGTTIKISAGGTLEITLAPDFNTSDYQQRITVPAGANVTIFGQGAVMDAARKGWFFDVPEGASLMLDSMTLQNGSAGAILNAGTLCMNSTTFETNSAMGNQRFGGAICNNKGATCTVRNSHFLSNKAVVGGAIHNRGDLHINSATFDHNQAKDQGGAIHNDGGGWGRGDLHIDNATFENNGAAWGGAINNRGTCNINSTAFLSNPTNYYNGGAIDNIGVCTVQNSDFLFNSARQGGAIHQAHTGDLYISSTAFGNNTAQWSAQDSRGGAISIEGGTLTINWQVGFKGNTAEVRQSALPCPYLTAAAGMLPVRSCRMQRDHGIRTTSGTTTPPSRSSGVTNGRTRWSQAAPFPSYRPVPQLPFLLPSRRPNRRPLPPHQPPRPPRPASRCQLASQRL
jgi:predicted outer membrane repeat protein